MSSLPVAGPSKSTICFLYRTQSATRVTATLRQQRRLVGYVLKRQHSLSCLRYKAYDEEHGMLEKVRKHFLTKLDKCKLYIASLPSSAYLERCRWRIWILLEYPYSSIMAQVTQTMSKYIARDIVEPKDADSTTVVLSRYGLCCTSCSFWFRSFVSLWTHTMISASRAHRSDCDTRTKPIPKFCSETPRTHTRTFSTWTSSPLWSSGTRNTTVRGFMRGPCNLQIWVPWLG